MPDREIEFYVFDKYRLDVRSRLLLRDGKPVRITSKPFDVLLHLVRKEGQLVKKEDLLNEVWGSDSAWASLANCIAALRRIFGETPGENRFIGTRATDGYFFVPPVVKEDAVGPVGLKTSDLPSGKPDADFVGTWISDDFNFVGDLIKAVFEFKRYGLLVAGTLHQTLSEKHKVHIRGGIRDVEIKGDTIRFVVMMDVWGMHGGVKYPLPFSGELAGDQLRLAAIFETGPAEFTATRVSAPPNPS